MAKPCTDCYLTSIVPNLVYEDGTTVNFATGGMLHHMVLFQFGGADATCDDSTLIGSLGERVYASGNERTAMSFPEGYGYYVGPADTWLLIIDIMNFEPFDQEMYLEFTFSYRPGSDGLKPVTPIWLDVDNCNDSEFSIPAGYSDSHWDWTADREGDIIAIGGHVHDSGISVAAEDVQAGEYICTSVAGYAAGSTFAPAPVPVGDAGHPGQSNVIDAPDTGYAGHIQDMTNCPSWFRLHAGDTVRLHTQHNAPASRDDVMGIMIAYMHETTDPPDYDEDGVSDSADNCPAWPNPDQSMPPWTVPSNDPDCDGSQSAREEGMGTLPMVQCAATLTADDEDPDPWPSDADDDQDSDVGDVIALFVGIVMNPANYQARSDFDGDGDVDVGDAVVGFGGGKILTSCA